MYFHVASKSSGLEARFFTVSGDYFRAMHTSILAGRVFERQDAADKAGIVVNENLARLYGAVGDAVGSHLVVEGESSPREIIGVVRDVKYASLGEPNEPQIYCPFMRPPRDKLPTELAFILRTGRNQSVPASILIQRISSVDSRMVVYDVTTMDGLVSQSLGSMRLRSILLAVFAVVAITLIIFGIYGVVSFVASNRTREFAIRMAVGARPVDILLTVLRQAAKPLLFGISLGLFLSVILSKLSFGLIFGVANSDASILLITGAILAAAALVSACIPAMKASRMHPADILRHE